MNNEISQENKRYKPSKYNFFFDAEDGTHLAFNAISCGFAELDNKDFFIIKDALSRHEIQYTKELKIETWGDLIKGGFIVEAEVNEINLLKMVNNTQRFNRTIDLSLTVLPTFACNLNCVYCYESVKRNEFMNDDVQNRLIKIIERRTGVLKNLHITWMGGEPLLGYKIISNLSQKIQEICLKRGIKYSSGIITNGYFLDATIFRKLTEEMSVNFFQITIDGPRDIHDRRRPLKTGGGSFDRIIYNLLQIAEVLNNKNKIKIVVRVNIDKGNADRAEELLEILAQNRLIDLLTVIPAQTVAATPSCQDITDMCFSSVEFYKNIQQKFLKKLIDMNFNFDIYPKLVGSNCVADRVNAYVVAPDGFLYKCWNDVGIRDESVGFIADNGKVVHNFKITKWLAFDPFDLNECSECKVFPLCGGGCAYKRLNSQGDLCVSWKYNIEELLKLFYLSKKKKKGGDKYEVFARANSGA
ncbi:MAG: SPASM domain-containing protein [candidate division WOR-3 bacterium]|nr:SPASM domain-containing protein [candidate division WOR-3 bacterium]